MINVMVNNSGSLNSNNNFAETSTVNEEFDLKLVFNFLQRNKKLLSLISVISLFSGFLISFFPKRTWEGQFQVVLSSEKEGRSNLSSIYSTLESFTGQPSANTLKTEVGILTSPSILIPVYEVTIANKNLNSKKTYEFSKWRKKLGIELKKGTSILNISYRDKDKNSILPVLEKLSSTYQNYSGERKKKINQFSQDSLEKQIKNFSKKSANSLRLAQEFAIDQDLIYFDPYQKENDVIRSFEVEGKLASPSTPLVEEKTSTFLPLNDSIERVRLQAANEIRKIDMTLKKIDELENDQSLQYVGSIIPEIIKSQFINTLRDVDAALIEAQSKYTEDDVTVKRLLEKRALTNKHLKESSINYLESKKIDSLAKLEAASRPKDVLLKYKELVRNAKRDENTLINLEDQLMNVFLNKSRKLVPWELITKPTLLNYPVDKTRLNLLIISLLGGFSLGSVYLLMKEKRSGRIFELNDLMKILPQGFVEMINTNEIKSLEEKIIYLGELINNEASEKINIILLGEIQQKKIEIVKQYLSKNKKNKINIEFKNSILDIKDEKSLNTNFLLLEFGAIKFSEIKTFTKYSQLFEVNINGTIILE